MNGDEQGALLSRSGHTHPQGKASVEFTVRLPEELAEKLIALAVINNCNRGEYIRDVLTAHVYGALSLLQGRVARSTASGAE